LVDLGHEQGWPVGRMPLGPTGPVPDPDYAAMDAGEIAEAEYLTRLLARLRDEDIDLDPRHDLDWQGEEREVVWRVIREVARSPLRQAILTNDASVWLGERWWRTWPHRLLFDAVVDVATIGVRKPAPEAYRHVLGILGAEPEQVVFVDDMTVNCRAAEAVGMTSVHLDLRDPDAAVATVRHLTGLDEET
ncbi:MAG: HAD-IA family hydrolase, partial [Phycicoccus sp.]